MQGKASKRVGLASGTRITSSTTVAAAAAHASVEYGMSSFHPTSILDGDKTEVEAGLLTASVVATKGGVGVAEIVDVSAENLVVASTVSSSDSNSGVTARRTIGLADFDLAVASV